MHQCLRCRKKTKSVNPHAEVASNGAICLKSKCGVCGCGKSRFISKKDYETLDAENKKINGKGLLSAIPIIGPILEKFL